MSWNSAMNVPETHRRPDRQGPGDRRIRDPAHHLFRCLLLGDGRLRRSDPARHDLSRALGLHLAARSADLRSRRPGRFDPPAGGRSPIATCGRSRTCCSISAPGSGLPGMTTADGRPRYPGGYPDYIVNHERAPGIGPLAGWRGADGSRRQGRAQSRASSSAISRMAASGSTSCRSTCTTTATPIGTISTGPQHSGFIGRPDPIVLQLYCEPLQKFRLAAQGHGEVRAAGRAPRAHRNLFRSRCRSGIRRFEEARDRRRGTSRCTPSPSGRWRCIIPGDRRMPGCARSSAATGSICPTSTRRRARPRRRRLGAGRQPPRPHQGRRSSSMDGVNPDTVWTWNAIGKRRGAWNLGAAMRPNSAKGFLLNHLIADLLPERDGGYRYANADPITGQAAWYDLRVRVEKAAPAAMSLPQFAASTCRLAPSRGRAFWMAVHDLASRQRGARPGQARPRHRPRHLRRLPGLRHLLQGMEHAGLFGTPDRSGSLWRRSHRASGSTASMATRTGEGAATRTVHFPRSCLHCEDAGLRHGLPDRRLLQARRGWHRAGQSRDLHRLQALLLGLPLWRARI